MPQSSLSQWVKVRAFAKSLAAMKGRLTSSSALDAAAGRQASRAAARYFATLRCGVKAAPVARAFAATRAAAQAAAAARETLRQGTVTLQVETPLQLDDVEYWQQGDAALQSEEKMAERQGLCPAPHQN